MQILEAHSLTAVGKVTPEAVELNLSERDSAAVLSLWDGSPELAVGRWLRDTEEPGAGIVWRVRTVDRQYDTATVRVTLEHLIQSLADVIIPGKATGTDMGGTSGGCTARQAIEYVLSYQSDWALGDFDDYEDVTNPYQFSGETLKAAIETVSSSLEDPVWSFDFTEYPFLLNIRKQSSAAECEMRAGRNIGTLRVSVDRSRMYTRLYPVGKNNLKLASPGYVSQNEDLWGVVEKTETDQSKGTREALAAWARDRLARHCDPTVTVTVSGLDLSEATGEPLDRLVIGRMCRVPLPEYGTTMLERITKLSWRDKVRDRESVTVTMANNPEDVQTILKQQSSGAAAKARTDAEVNEEHEMTIGWVESGLYTRIAQTASEIRREAHRESESLRTFVIQTASAIRQEAQDDKESLRTLVLQTASAIRQEVEDGQESLRTLVLQTASSWEARVEGVAGSDGRITAASIAVAINDSTGESEAKINAERVYIGSSRSTTVISGKAAVTDLQATDAKVESITIVEGSARYINSDKVYCLGTLSVGSGASGGSGTFYFRGESYSKTSVVIKDKNAATVAEGSCLGTGGSTTPINLSHYHEITVTEGTGALAGKMVVTLGAAQATEGSANFNIADTQTYIDGVSAARTAGKNSVGLKTIGSGDWAHTPVSGIAYSSNTVNYSTDGKPTETVKTLSLYMDQTVWNNGSKVVYVSWGSAARANSVAQLTVTGPDTSQARIIGVSGLDSSGADVSFDVSIGTSPSGGIPEEWATDSVTLSGALEAKNVTLSGSPQTITATGTGKIGLYEVNVPALPAISLKDERFTANGEYTVPSGYDGWGTLTIDVASGTPVISITPIGVQSARAGQSAVDLFIAGATRILSGYTIQKDGNYDNYYKFRVNAGSSEKVYYIRV